MIDRLPCSNQSRDRHDPLYGTASAGLSWLLLEVAGGWGPSAFTGSPSVLDPALGLAIVRRAEASGMRIAAIRRPGRRESPSRWRWFIASSRPGQEWLVGGEVASPQDYLDVPLDGSAGQPVDGPLVIVCAHGRHDQCCAVRGRVVAGAIAARYPQETWECSHVGGDRFAATMILLPHGLSYGRVDSVDDPASIVAAYTQGRVDDSLLRGRTAYSHVVQAAQHFARTQHGDDHIDAYAPLAVREDGDVSTVLLAADPKPLEVALQATLSEPLLSTCHARIPGRVTQFALRSVRTATG
ncbi:sucrase ferredoxin [Branchiibius sp. NY16-3462-2]|uniref:sucrase ferredoxin n=1 Tax=Branchiibius sp. NY16-3462-2 TaxID=1807500 RepID=UPI000B0400A3|nr:sucrase ferredoxin [Branchiibius sp. NY16-3462-2]